MKYKFKNSKTKKIILASSLSISLILNGCCQTTNNKIESENDNNNETYSSDTYETSETLTSSTDEPTLTSSEESSNTSEESETQSQFPTYEDNNVSIESRNSDLIINQYFIENLQSYQYGNAFYSNFAFGVDYPRYRMYIEEYIRDYYNIDLEYATIDDINYLNNTQASPFNFDDDYAELIVNQIRYEDYKVVRACLLSLDLIPFLNEIPAQYFANYLSNYYEMSDSELESFLVNFQFDNPSSNSDLVFMEILCYNMGVNHTSLYRNVPYCRTSTGVFTMDIKPTDPRYTTIINAFAKLGMPLNTQTMIDPETGEEIEVIVPDTPEHFEEIFGESYTDVLERAGLPLNPEHDNFFPDPNSYGFMVDANENEVEKNASHFRTR